jgi:TolB protein
MNRKFKFSLLLMLFLVSVICATGTSVALKEQTENSLEVSDIISISNVTDSYYEELARDENVTYTDRSLLCSWSPDGSQVLVLTRYAPIGTPELDAFYLVNADGTEPEEIVATRNNTMEKSLGLIADEDFKIARWNSDGDRFAFNANIVRVNDTFIVINGETFVGAAGMGIVCIADIDGDVVRSASTGLSGVDSIRENSTDIGRVHGLDWEPDGTDAAVIINDQLYVTDQYVSYLNQLTNSSIEESIDECMWNHQGNMIAFAGEELWIVDKHDGSGLKKLASDVSRLIGWSQDDSMICYSSYGDGISSQYVVRLNDSKITKITTGSLDDYLVIGPDGRMLFTNSTFGDGDLISSGLYVADADGTNKKLLGENDSIYAYLTSKASWSPDGDKIATAFNIINANGSGKYDIELGRTFSWHPSGDYIAFETGDYVGDRYITRVCVANSDGSGITQVSPDDDCSYSFDGWSPDGSRMLITKGVREELIVVRFSEFDEIMSIDFKEYNIPGKELNIVVTSMSQPVENALITMDGRELGLTDEKGCLNYTITESGIHIVNASKEGYFASGKQLTIYDDSYSSVKDDDVSDSTGNPEESVSTILTPFQDWLDSLTGN